jgi:hypothetical protein
MRMKVLEVRDDGTFISVLAIKLSADDPIQAYYLYDRCGYPCGGEAIGLVVLDDFRGANDPIEWESRGFGPRTMPVAHDWIYGNFDLLNDGDVVDVEHILGETSTKKTSERLSKM